MSAGLYNRDEHPQLSRSDMKEFVLLLVSLLFAIGSSINAQVPGNVITRVFDIRVGGETGETGSAFVLDYEDQQYLVTAEHMVASLPTTGSLDILQNDEKWHPVKVKVLHGKQPCDDVAVLIPESWTNLRIDDLPILPNWFMGQEVYFLGFPYGLFTYFANGVVTSPVPLVKHGYVSALVSCSALNPGADADKKLLLLDGMNNPGFSGGPVVAPDLDQAGHPMKLVGVISAFAGEKLAVSSKDQKASEESVNVNTGIVVVIPIAAVTNLILEDQKKTAH